MRAVWEIEYNDVVRHRVIGLSVCAGMIGRQWLPGGRLLTVHVHPSDACGEVQPLR